MEAGDVITLSNISVAYGARPAVRNISVSAEAGQLVALVGPNGSGKSSLMKAIAGLIPSTGRADRPDRMAYLAQSPVAPDRARVREVVALGRTPYLGLMAKMRDTDRDAVDAALAETGIPDMAERRMAELSGGERMRVHLARVLATDAPLIIVDEPIAALDPYYQLVVMDILKAQAAKGRLVLAALHDLTVVRRDANTVWVLKDGTLVAQGAPETALNEKTLATVFRIATDGLRIAT